MVLWLTIIGKFYLRWAFIFLSFHLSHVHFGRRTFTLGTVPLLEGARACRARHLRAASNLAPRRDRSLGPPRPVGQPAALSRSFSSHVSHTSCSDTPPLLCAALSGPPPKLWFCTLSVVYLFALSIHRFSTLFRLGGHGQGHRPHLQFVTVRSLVRRLFLLSVSFRTVFWFGSDIRPWVL